MTQSLPSWARQRHAVSMPPLRAGISCVFCAP